NQRADWMTARAEKRVRTQETQGHQQRVKHQETIGAEQPDERGRQQRIDERLREIQVRVVTLEEDAFGPGLELVPHAHEIFPLILEVKIVGNAVAERVVGGGIAEEAVVRR